VLNLTSHQLEEYTSAPRVWLALSGGVDSVALLHWAVSQSISNLSIIHVNHNLQAEADSWADFCRSLASRYSLPVEIVSVHVDPTVGAEEGARNARYQAFEQVLGSHEILIQAHHANDQAETFLFRLMRSASFRSLASIPRRRQLGKGLILRPLLDVSRREIEQYAQDNSLEYIIDPSNSEQLLDRNYLRHTVLPALVKRWPHAVKKLSSAADQMARQDQALSQLSKFWLNQQVQADGFGEYLDFDAFIKLAADARFSVLSGWLYSRASESISGSLFQQLIGRPESLVSTAFEVRLSNLVIYADGTKLRLETDQVRKAVSAEPLIVNDPGIEVASISICAVERFKPRGRDKSQRVKKLLQEWRIPARYRAQLPVCLYEGSPIALGGYSTAEFSSKYPDTQVFWPNMGDCNN